MEMLAWDAERYSVGDPRLDSDHKKIINYVSQITALWSAESPSAEVMGKIQEMEQFLLEHYQLEEELLEKFERETLRQQQNSHREFLNTLSKIDTEEGMTLEQAVDYLQHWWQDHIINQDREFRRYFES